MTHKNKPYIRRDWLAHKKVIYERRMAGESYESIGASLGISLHTAAMHAGDWKYLIEKSEENRAYDKDREIIKELTTTHARLSEEYGYA